LKRRDVRQTGTARPHNSELNLPHDSRGTSVIYRAPGDFFFD